MDNKSLGFPDPEVLCGTGLTMNYHIIGDDAFPLREDLLKPHPDRQLDADQRIFNYRFSRARRVVEDALADVGIICHGRNQFPDIMKAAYIYVLKQTRLYMHEPFSSTGLPPHFLYQLINLCCIEIQK
eukprot:gene13219-14568_t